MRVALDMGALGQDKDTGVQKATVSWCRSLIETYSKVEFVLTGLMARAHRQKIEAYEWADRANVTKKIWYLPSRLVSRTAAWMQRTSWVPIEKGTGRVDIYHSFDGVHLTSRAVSTTVIWDLSTHLFPNWHPKVNVFAQEERTRAILCKAKHWFCISGFIRKQVIAEWQLKPHQVSVLPVGLETKPQVGSQRVKRILTNLDLKTKYLLFVGRLEPRKNLIRLIKAHQELIKNNRYNHLLVIAGDIGWDDEAYRMLRRAEKIVFLGRVTDEELAALYTEAEALVYPSVYEGFGLPVLEAMSMGCLVVTSKGTSMEEVIGETGILVNPLSVVSLEKGLEKAMKLGGGERSRLVKAAMERSKMFEGKVAAEKMMSVWQKLLG